MKRTATPPQPDLFGPPPATARRSILTHWSSTRVLVLAGRRRPRSVSNNFWQFPHLLGSYGGGVFDRLSRLPRAHRRATAHGRADARAAGTCVAGRPLRHLAGLTRSDPNWAMVGAMGVIAGFLIFAYLSVIAGWTLPTRCARWSARSPASPPTASAASSRNW